MSRTVTGSYTLRPTSYRTYRSSGTFSDWFYTSSSVSAPSTWRYNMNPGTKIGDNSDSTYYSDTGVTHINDYAENAIMNLTVSSGTVPSVDYSITSVTLTYRAKASTTTDASRKLNIWNTIWYSGGNKSYTPTACISAGNFGWKTAKVSTYSVTTATTSIANYESSHTPTDGDMPAGTYPDMHAICVQAYKTSALVSFSYWYLYDVWYTVEWSYTEDELTGTVYTDKGVAVTGGASVSAGTTAGKSFAGYAGDSKTMKARVLRGYEWDGWYDGTQKVSSDLSYSISMSDGLTLYALSKARNVFVGTEPAAAVYVGNTEVTEIDVGANRIWGDSPLLTAATGG